MNKLKTLNNPSGYSLVEVMLVVAIMGMVGLGAASMMKNTMSVQRRQELRPTLRVIKFQLEQALKNDQAWEATIGHADNGGAVTTELGCLIDGDNVQCTDGTIINNPHIVDIDGATIFEGTDATAGWNYSGGICNAWAAGGNNGCPIRYNLQVLLECRSGAATCHRPAVVISATLNYAPQNRASIENRINVLDYGIDLRRDERVRFEPFVVVGVQDNGEFGGHGGPCTDGAGVARKLTRVDSGLGAADNVTVDTAADTFTLTGPGYYTCEIMAEGWNAMEGFLVKVEGATVNESLGAGYSRIMPAGSEQATQVRASVHLTIPAGGEALQIVHYCFDRADDAGMPATTWGISSDNGGAENRTMGLGVPAGEHDPNNPKVFTRIECIRTS